MHITPAFEYFRNFIYIEMENYYQPNNLKMKKIILLITNVLIGMTLSAQTMVFNVQEIKAKDFAQSDIEAAYDTCCGDMKPN